MIQKQVVMSTVKEVNIQERIDSIAFDLSKNNGKFYDHSPETLAGLLDLCPEQDVWMYEPDPSDLDASNIFATFRLVANNGMIFHMSCLMNEDSEVLEWIGPHDIQKGFAAGTPDAIQAIAA